MKLYSRPLSPYSARVRVALHAKGLAFQHEIVEMGWSKNPAFLEVNPLGRVPVLELDDGTRLIESSAIVEYLDDAHPEPPLRSPDPRARARERALALLAEHDVLKPMMDVFILVDRKQDASEAQQKLATGMKHVERCLDADASLVHAGARRVTLADAILLPVRHSLASLVSFGNLPELLAPYPRLDAYASSAKEVPALATVWSEMDEGLKVFMAWRAKQAASQVP